VSAKHTTKPSDTRPKRGRADLDRLDEMSEAEIAESSPPELTDLPPDFWDEAQVVMPEAKEAISLRVDRDVLAWFREAGPRYQTRMNAVLRSYMNSKRRLRRSQSHKPRKDGSQTGAS